MSKVDYRNKVLPMFLILTCSSLYSTQTDNCSCHEMDFVMQIITLLREEKLADY